MRTSEAWHWRRSEHRDHSRTETCSHILIHIYQLIHVHIKLESMYTCMYVKFVCGGYSYYELSLPSLPRHATLSVTVSLVSIKGTDCRVMELGQVADKTGGQVRATPGSGGGGSCFSFLLANPFPLSVSSSTLLLFLFDTPTYFLLAIPPCDVYTYMYLFSPAFPTHSNSLSSRSHSR